MKSFKFLYVPKFQITQKVIYYIIKRHSLFFFAPAVFLLFGWLTHLFFFFLIQGLIYFFFAWALVSLFFFHLFPKLFVFFISRRPLYAFLFHDFAHFFAVLFLGFALIFFLPSNVSLFRFFEIMRLVSTLMFFLSSFFHKKCEISGGNGRAT